MRPIVAVVALALLLPVPAGADTAAPAVALVRIDDRPITPVTARFLHRALRRAAELRAVCVVIELDTPGGLMDATRAIVRDILASPVPVVVYVAPSGARAASAGLFITLAGDVAAMAPGTNIGAAHPVRLGGLPVGPRETPQGEGARPERSPMEDKLVQDTRAWARALAELRGRNATWAERAVAESLSITAREALAEHVVDLVAPDLDALLAALDGRELVRFGAPVRLHTRGARVHTVEMWAGERVLTALSNPNIAFLLLIFGFYGLLFELYTPGWGVGGTLGVLCLVLAFFALSVLPVSYAGLALLAVGLGMLVAEVFVTSFGLLAIGGVVCLALGGMMLFESPSGFFRVSAGVAIAVAVPTGAITVFLLSRVVAAQRGRALTGGEAMLGARGTSVGAFAPGDGGYAGTVLVHGEYWKATSEIPVGAGDAVEVAGRDGLTLRVTEPANEEVTS